MAIRAVVFDIGGVLVLTPDLGVTRRWETALGLPPGAIDERMHDTWLSSSIGTITEDDVRRAVAVTVVTFSDRPDDRPVPPLARVYT